MERGRRLTSIRMGWASPAVKSCIIGREESRDRAVVLGFEKDVDACENKVKETWEGSTAQEWETPSLSEVDLSSRVGLIVWSDFFFFFSFKHGSCLAICTLFLCLAVGVQRSKPGQWPHRREQHIQQWSWEHLGLKLRDGGRSWHVRGRRTWGQWSWGRTHPNSTYCELEVAPC